MSLLKVTAYFRFKPISRPTGTSQVARIIAHRLSLRNHDTMHAYGIRLIKLLALLCAVVTIGQRFDVERRSNGVESSRIAGVATA